MNAHKALAEMVGALADAELVRRIRGGETALFELVMRRYNQRLFRVLRALASVGIFGPGRPSNKSVTYVLGHAYLCAS